MKFNLLCILAISASQQAHAFTSSSSRTLTSHRTASTKNSLLVRYSTATPPDTKKSWKDVHQFNMDLDKMAEKCGSFDQPVISRAAECEELWNAMSADTDAPLRPDTISFNTVLKAWNRCCNILSESTRNHRMLPKDHTHGVDVYSQRDAAKHATGLLLKQESHETVKPDVASFNIVIDAWAKSRLTEAPEAAERLLKRLIDSESMEPDTLSYHGVLDAWANSGREDALGKVRQIFHHMEGLKDDGKNVNPSIRTVNAIMNAYAKRASRYTTNFNDRDPVKAAECAADAHELLEQIKLKYAETQDHDWQPDVTTYTSVMDVYARGGSYTGTQQAESLLEELKEQYKATNDLRLRPNFRTYTTLITAWSRTRSPLSPGKVDALLEEMAKSPATRPNSRAYTSAVQCWAKSRDARKAKRALSILREMRDEHKKTGNADVLPSILTYNAAIDACARCQGTMEQQTEALKISFAIVKAIDADPTTRPNQVTYATVLKGVSFLLPAGNERNKIASAVFEKARKAGLVEFATLKNLRKSVDAEVMMTLLEGVVDQYGNFDYADLPAAWSKNCK